ncbi:hypothetical protein CALVIDRAFT_41591 [Calocera viscosa TUFC12733]|uniref:K Homology domain-containing protein n=1 Tax=Calocera viscosa (strain TUFC12733) TaxID=1330018 RepID=A0A167P324_CALVF|nr:hypothetical protein CALVIDRAFT_41591 [Calocera viscosa TUFC12733]
MPSSPPNSPPPNPTSPRGQPSANPAEILTLRALVSTKDAGIIIGKAGRNVADLRESTGVKAGVSKVVPGVHERVLSVTGPVEAVAKAYTLIASQLLSPPAPPSPPQTPPPSPPNQASTLTLRLLISHNLMGTLIGRSGLKIKSIQDASGVRMVAAKEMLPQSTERVVEVIGDAESIGRAVEEVGRCLVEDWERGVGTVLYHPGAAVDPSLAMQHGTSHVSPRRTNGQMPAFGSGGRRQSLGQQTSLPSAASVLAPTAAPTSPTSNAANQPIRTQNISIPSDMVGCIIGRGGAKITEIRRLSGSKISIAKQPHDETGERMFTITGTGESNEKALFLLYNQLEGEKERRVGREAMNASAE